MTTQELIIKLEECRSQLDNVKDKDDQANEAYYTINGLITEIEDEGLSGDEFFSSGRNRGRWQEWNREYYNGYLMCLVLYM